MSSWVSSGHAQRTRVADRLEDRRCAQSLGHQGEEAISDLGLKPDAKKGVCSYYAAGDVPKFKKALK
jgi:hypothetical protein